jgi:AraC-like DNA-binding protein
MREGTTFQTLLDQTRHVMACELLQFTQLPIGDVADALAYSSQSDFGEALRRWSGATPSEFRRRH